MTLRRVAIPLAVVFALTLWLVSATHLQAHGAVSSSPCRTWKIIPTPGFEGYALSGVSGTSSADVWAVGDDYGGLPPLALHWDGSAWTQVPVADTGGFGDVVAISSTDAWMVGDGGYSVAVQHWDGRAWTPIDAPSPGYNFANGVDDVSSMDVWMVGSYTLPDLTVQPFAEHWDGVKWKIIQPQPVIYGGVLYKVSALSSDDVWAVGYQGTVNAFEFQPLIEHWDGRAWSVVPVAPPPSGTNDQLYDVVAVSSTDVWAVGLYGGPDPAQPLIEHWDGASWALVPVPALRGVDELFGVAAISSSDIWAVGKSVAPNFFDYRPFTMHWDGSTWTPYRAPPRNVSGSLAGVWALSSPTVLAVGADTPGEIQPLIEVSRGPCD